MDTPLTLINNTGYGAPELKNSYQGITLRGLIIAISIHISIIIIYLLVSYINNANAKDIPVNHNEKFYFVETDLTKTNEEQVQKEISHEIVSKLTKDIASLEPIPVRKDISDNIKTKTQSELDNIQQTTSRNGDTNNYASNIKANIKIDDGFVDKNTTKRIDPIKEYQPHEVEKVPECVNLTQVKGSIIYPNLDVETGTEGKVTIKVLVDESGNVTETGKMSGPEIFYDEVKEKSRGLKFTAGLQNNKPVKVWMTIPFSFKLKN